MEQPAPDPVKLLEFWMSWETGDSTPGRVLADLKKHGMRQVLETLAEAMTSVES